MRPRQSRAVHPSQIRRRSDYAAHYERPMNVMPTAEVLETPMGARSEGYKGEFEIHYEFVAKGARTPHIVHPKKDRVVKVLDGSGVLHTSSGAETKTQTVQRGDDVVLTAGMEYSISSTTPLYLMFIQPKAYEARVQKLTPAIEPVNNSVEVNREQEVEVAPVRPRRGSLAREQQALIAAERNRRLGIVEQPQALGRAPVSTGSTSPMPTYGDLPGEPG